MSPRRRVLVIALMSLVGAVTSCSGSSVSRPRAHTVSISNFAFTPGELTIARGDTVVWANADFVPHSATGRNGRWDSGSVAAGASWRFVADSAGRYEYYCVLHPSMTGTIVAR